jgi:hypothetical protein
MGKYGVILADPPWQYANAGCRGAAENQYPTMAIKDLCARPNWDVWGNQVDSTVELTAVPQGVLL